MKIPGGLFIGKKGSLRRTRKVFAVGKVETPRFMSAEYYYLTNVLYIFIFQLDFSHPRRGLGGKISRALEKNFKLPLRSGCFPRGFSLRKAGRNAREGV
jgi:hypothetical protein